MIGSRNEADLHALRLYTGEARPVSAWYVLLPSVPQLVPRAHQVKPCQGKTYSQSHRDQKFAVTP